MFRNVVFASATVLIAMSAPVRAMDTGDLAARAGFLIGASRYCGVSPMRTNHVRQWIGSQLVAAAESRQAVYRFDDFVNAASSASHDGDLSVRCKAITDAFATLERHITHSRFGHGKKHFRRPDRSDAGAAPTRRQGVWRNADALNQSRSHPCASALKLFNSRVTTAREARIYWAEYRLQMAYGQN